MAEFFAWPSRGTQTIKFLESKYGLSGIVELFQICDSAAHSTHLNFYFATGLFDPRVKMNDQDENE